MHLPLTVYLLHRGSDPMGVLSESMRPHARFIAWTNGKLDELGPSDQELLGAAQPGDIVVALLRHPGSFPDWVSLIQNSFAAAELESAVSGFADFRVPPDTLGALVFCATTDVNDEGITLLRWLVWCFGSGARAVTRSASEARFGLFTFLNALVQGSVEPDHRDGEVTAGRRGRLRHLRYRSTTPAVQQTDHQAARDIPISGFRFDRQSDLLLRAGGRTGDPVLGTALGGRSLHFSAEVDKIQDLTELSATVLVRSKELSYRDEFPWMDYIRPVTDNSLVDVLRNRLLEGLLTTPLPASIDVLLPDDLPRSEDGLAIEYVLFPQEWASKGGSKTLTIRRIALWIARKDPSEQLAALNSRLRFLNSDRQELGYASLLECLSGELTWEGATYVTDDGAFYRIDPDFLRAVEEDVGALRESSITLPCYVGGSEPAYNADAARACPRRLMLMHGQLLRLPHETGVEACDLIDRSGALVHVKRKGKSSVLSHLLLQAVNSCRLLRRSTEALSQLRNAIAGATVDSTLREAVLTRLDAGVRDLEVVFAFLGDWKDQSVGDLPLFSKVALVGAAQQLEELGYLPMWRLVGLCSEGNSND